MQVYLSFPGVLYNTTFNFDPKSHDNCDLHLEGSPCGVGQSEAPLSPGYAQHHGLFISPSLHK